MVRQMTDAERWRAIGMLEANASIRAVSRAMGRSHSTIRKLLIKYRSSGNVQHARKGRRGLRLSVARADRRLIRLVRGNPTMPATLLRMMWHVRGRRGFLLSAQTVRRRIKEAGIRCRRMRRRLRLSPAHVIARERWAMERIHWRQNQWQRVIFTDESRFRLFQSDGRIRVWRDPNTAFHPAHIQYSERQSRSLHVWAGITMNSRTELVFLDSAVTAQHYGNILQQHLMPFVDREFQGVQNCILQDDNAPPHRAHIVTELKRDIGLRTLRWPSRSPDMNPIEHVWSYMKLMINRQTNPPTNLQHLRTLMNDIWLQMPQDLLRRLVLTLPKRVHALLLSRGAYTRY